MSAESLETDCGWIRLNWTGDPAQSKVGQRRYIKSSLPEPTSRVSNLSTRYQSSYPSLYPDGQADRQAVNPLPSFPFLISDLLLSLPPLSPSSLILPVLSGSHRPEDAKMGTLTKYNIAICLVVSWGGYAYGFGFAIFVTSIGQPGFYEYFKLDREYLSSPSSDPHPAIQPSPPGRSVRSAGHAER